MADAVRHAGERDVDQVVDLANRVFRAQRAGDMGREFPILLSPENASNLCVAERGGRIVSLVGRLPQQMRIEGAAVPVSAIGAVCTEPACRGLGLAGAALDLAINDARRAGDAWMMISGGRGLYTRRHALPLGPMHELAVARPALGTPAGRAMQDGDVPSAVELMQRRPVRYQIDAAEFRRRAAVKDAFGGMFWAHESGGAIDAWALVFYGGPLHSRLGAGELQLVDWAGSPAAVSAVAAAALDHLARSTLLVRLPWHEREAIDHFTPLAHRSQVHCRPGVTLKLMDAARVVELFTERFAPLDASAEGSSLSLQVGGKRVTLTDSAAIHHLLFTRPTHWPSDARLPRELAAAAGSVLPIPVPDYGMCYV